MPGAGAASGPGPRNAAGLEIRLIGAFDVRAGGRPVTLPSRAAQSILAFLVLNAGKAFRREKLAGMFWPDSTEERARASLRHELWRIRRALGGDGMDNALVADELSISLDPHALSHLDARHLESLSDQADADELIRALRDSCGELLPGFYEDWIIPERGRLQTLRNKYLQRLLELLARAARWPEVIEWAERWISEEGSSEIAYQNLISAHAARGDHTQMMLAYDRCVQALHALGLAPSAELQRLLRSPVSSEQGNSSAAADRSTASLSAPGPLSTPSGTVTFVFTDIEGSTRMARQYRDGWEQLRGRHHSLLRLAFEAHHGYVFEIVGDAFCVAFDRPVDALLGALAAQRSLQAEHWDPEPVRVRMGIHAGAAESWGKGYRGYLTLSSAQRVMSTAHGGQVILSQSAYDLIESDLPDDLELRDMGEHRLKDLLRRQHLYQLVVADLPSEFPPLRSLDVQPHNLPVQLTTFIGRNRELAETAALLDRNRLVTLTGLAGTGKTRLALQVAAEVLHLFPDGAWFVDLAPLSDPASIPQVILSALRIQEHPGRSTLDVLRDALASRRLLLILDNCEHLIDACANVADDLLHAAPAIRLLATSRESLRIAGSSNYPVQSLPMPDSSATTARAISQCDAVHLFLDRVETAQPAFRISDDNAGTVAQICVRLDGIPLALELAAARISGMTVEQIAARLDDRFRLLTGGSRTALPRQRTLRATIDWSHDLLSTPERTLLRRLGVFLGGWTLDAAQNVCSSEDLDARDIPDLLAALVEKSLVILDMTSSRYRFLETVREYALERLREADEEPALRSRHVDYFTHEAEAADPVLTGGDMAVIVLTRESHNLISAIRWCESAPGEIPRGLRLIGASRWVWFSLCEPEPIHSIARRFLARPEAAPRTNQRLASLLLMVQTGFDLGHYDDLRPQLEESLSIARELHNARAEGAALYWFGVVLAELGDQAGAITHLEQALALSRSHGLMRLESGCLISLGEISRAAGDFARARALYEEAMSLDLQTGAQLLLFVSLMNLSAVTIQMGDLAAAVGRLEQALDLLEELSWLAPSALLLLEVCAGYLAEAAQFRNAAVLYGAAEHQREVGGQIIERTDRLFIEPLRERTRQALGTHQFEAALAEGRALDLQQAFTLARTWVSSQR